jgi:hypothetical protein
MPNTQAIRGATESTPSVTPLFPLLLLETLRDMDRPDEVLEGEDLSASMPRRLGLSDVVYVQIHRFREEVRRKRLQTAATVEDLIRLVIKRHDADEIFEEAGRRVARRIWEERSRRRAASCASFPPPWPCAARAAPPIASSARCRELPGWTCAASPPRCRW